MQKQVRILVLLVFALPVSFAKGQPADLKTADSLFSARQYTQAFEQYLALRQNGNWSPAMFLKMAYIQEGLGHLGESLYYLNLYALTSHDPQATVKMAELAEKNRLEGYGDNPWENFRMPLRKYYGPIAGLLVALSILLLALQFNRSRSHKPFSPALATVMGLLLVGLFFHVHYSRLSSSAIVTRGNTYLMSSPSAGASVVSIIGEGHRLHIKGRSDAWLRIEWREGDAYIRDFHVKPIQL